MATILQAWAGRAELQYSGNAAINFIQNHLPRTNPWDITQRGQKTKFPGTIVVYKKPPLGTKQGVKSPIPATLKSENFTNVSINSDNIWNEKLCGLNKKKTVFSMRRLIIKVDIIWQSPESNFWTYKSFYDMYKCILIIFWEEGAWNYTKKYFEFLSIPS